jgi:hypothetical protein
MMFSTLFRSRIVYDSSGKCRDCTLKLGHDHFLLNQFQFIIQLSPFNSIIFVIVSEKTS